MSKRTPGPWIVVPDMNTYVIRGAEVLRESVAGVNFMFRDFVASTWGEQTNQNKANASLIAASPELLQALQLVAAHIPEIIASDILTAAETDTIRAAITKAGD